MDSKDFRNALGQFPTGVTVITTLNGEEPIGVTASSFNSVSMDPPLILWSVAKSAYSCDIFKESEFFIVNVLEESQIELSNNCARQGDDKFSKIKYQNGVGNCPLLDDTIAHFECKTYATYDGGDHTIILGEVVNYKYDKMKKPLVYAQGSYAKAMPH